MVKGRQADSRPSSVSKRKRGRNIQIVPELNSLPRVVAATRVRPINLGTLESDPVNGFDNGNESQNYRRWSRNGLYDPRVLRCLVEVCY